MFYPPKTPKMPTVPKKPPAEKPKPCGDKHPGWADVCEREQGHSGPYHESEYAVWPMKEKR